MVTPRGGLLLLRHQVVVVVGLNLLCPVHMWWVVPVVVPPLELVHRPSLSATTSDHSQTVSDSEIPVALGHTSTYV